MANISMEDIRSYSRKYCDSHSLGDDLMFECAADGNNTELGNHIIQTAYGDPSIRLTSFTTQYHLRSFPKFHKAVLDGIGFDVSGHIWPVELQFRKTVSFTSFNRWEYYEAEVTAHSLLAGHPYNTLANRQFTIITKQDYFSKDKPCCTVEFTVDELEHAPVSSFPDRVSGKIVFKILSDMVTGDDPKTILAQSLFQKNLSKVKDPVVKKWLEFMRSEEGVTKMEGILKQFGDELLQKQMENIIISMKANGASDEFIKNVVDDVTKEDSKEVEDTLNE